MLSTRMMMSSRTIREITIGSDTNNVNLRTLHDASFPSVPGGSLIRFFISSGVVVGSTSTGSAALQTGSWPSDVTVELHNLGRIAGRGGNGGQGGTATADVEQQAGHPGQPGGLGMLVAAPLNVNNTSGVIAGGGGGAGGGAGAGGNSSLGGGGGGAGGGAGRNVGAAGAGGGSVGGTPGQNGNPGALTAGGSPGQGGVGAAGDGGSGGNPGQAGSPGQNSSDISGTHLGGAGGAAGAAIDGIANITWVDEVGDPTVDDGTILGPTS